VGNGAVELFGLCGSGKTTLARAMEGSPTSTLWVEGPVKPSGTSALLWTVRLVAGHLFGDPAGCLRLLRSPGGSWLHFKLGYRLAGLRMRGDLIGRLLLDSGVLQPLISFDVEYNLDLVPWDVDPLVRLLPLPSCALYVRVQPEVAMRRYLAREQAHGRTVPMKRVEDRFYRGFKTAENLYHICIKNQIPCIVFDN